MPASAARLTGLKENSMKQRTHLYSPTIGLAILLTLVLAGCSIGGGESSLPSTATAPPPPTNPPTPMPTNTVAPTLPPTDTPIPTVETVSMEGVLYYDDFTDTGSGWDRIAFDNSYIGYHEPGYYHVEVHAPNSNELVPIPDQSFTDFTAEVEAFFEADLSIAEGDSSYGLVFRRSGNLYYAFTISPFTKNWSVTKHSLSGVEILQEGNTDAVQGVGVLNILRVDARADGFTFHINGETVAQLRDADYASGEVGFFVQTLDNQKTHIHFETITIREVELPQMVCNLVAQSVNLRSGPSRDFRRLTTLLRGDEFEPLERTQNGLWIRVRLGDSDQEGWIANDRDYAECNIPIEDLPVSEP
jgi:hypothetical protein